MRGTGAPVLYLDFDGVLHHENVFWHPNIGPYISGAPDGYVLFQHAELLEKMLQPYPKVEIVLSTSWVRRYGCASAAKQLRPSQRARVVGATFRARMGVQDFLAKPRGMQVLDDALRRKPKSWLALDDDGLGWPEGSLAKLIKTHPHEGISDPAVQEELRAKLKELYRA